MKVLLSGIVGSIAYGLGTTGSDVDRLGVYAEAASAFHGLNLPIDKAASKVTTNPDIQLHEARKYAQLCLRANPTVTELLWLPDDLYEERTGMGTWLIGIREHFLSAQRVRDAYLGYASQQLGRLVKTGQFASKMRKRQEKHGRHLLRLLDQGFQLYSTGHLDVRVEDAERYRRFGEEVATRPQAAEGTMAMYEEKFDSVTTPLLDVPDVATVEDWLINVRSYYPSVEI